VETVVTKMEILNAEMALFLKSSNDQFEALENKSVDFAAKLGALRKHVEALPDTLILSSNQITVAASAGFATKPMNLFEVLKLCNTSIMSLQGITSEHTNQIADNVKATSKKADETVLVDINQHDTRLLAIEDKLRRDEEEGVNALRKSCKQLADMVEHLKFDMDEKVRGPPSTAPPPLPLVPPVLTPPLSLPPHCSLSGGCASGGFHRAQEVRGDRALPQGRYTPPSCPLPSTPHSCHPQVWPPHLPVVSARPPSLLLTHSLFLSRVTGRFECDARRRREIQGEGRGIPPLGAEAVRHEGGQSRVGTHAGVHFGRGNDVEEAAEGQGKSEGGTRVLFVWV